MIYKPVTWSTLCYLRRSCTELSWRLIWRSVYSKTGIWEKDLDTKVKREIEEYWRPKITGCTASPSEAGDREKFYVLSMFPYPSGQLHMGHVRVYTISDAIARYHRLRGRQVIHPMGWDAFGLPAENAAIDRGELPDKWTYRNIASMRQQMDEMCFSFDWGREVMTCDPSYYKWTQYIFLKMYEAGLVYQKEAQVNWDPLDQTVLAEEQIDEDGRSWRSGALVEKRYLRQWYIRTTAYAKPLYEGLDTVNPELWRDIILLQRNWIRECTGTRLDFKILHNGGYLADPLSVFLAHPEMAFGVSHIAVAQEHRLNSPDFCSRVSYKEQSSDFVLHDLQVEHPLTKEKLPVIVSKTTEFDEFNNTHPGVPSISEMDRKVADMLGIKWINTLSEDGNLINSHQFTGLSRKEGVEAIAKYARELRVGGHMVSSKLSDWLISRQRYWGTPIPIIHCQACGALPVPYEDLPVKLPRIETFSARGASPLAQQADWVNVTCSKCKGPARRETDTMDTFVDSSWYFLRYLDSNNTKELCSSGKAAKYMPVDLYVGGKEHAVLHMYYARFFNYFLHDLGIVPSCEPFVNLLTQGMVLGQSYRVKDTGRYLARDQVDFSGKELVEKKTGSPLIVEWEKMSKSKYNGVDPQAVLEEYGVDSTRLCILGLVSPKADRKWSNDSFVGILKWQGRVWHLVTTFMKQSEIKKEEPLVDTDLLHKAEREITEARNFFLKEVTFHFDVTFLVSTAVSRLQGFKNSLTKFPEFLMGHSIQFERALADLIIMTAPFAPSFASELWTGMASVASRKTEHNWDKHVLEQMWPTVDMNYELPVCVRDDARDLFEVKVPRYKLDKLTQNEALDIIRGHEQYQICISPKTIERVKFILYPGYSAVLQFSLVGSTLDCLNSEEKEKILKETMLLKEQKKKEKEEKKKIREIRRAENIAKREKKSN
ncbi:hypothetical protein CHS0354_030569 [Potamilus streckersoni]|uniref:leucine--tRNA ligase n=1 Tax=Potamilus streckersoni TaxID=2493646 RepID=A0AAE0S3G0_9BIVA|nr:hypothetical protein CHS0354_030569 [Potamilus streckersoni]